MVSLPSVSLGQVTASRRRRKAILVAEAGGRCAACGYDRYAGALQFHHLDPAGKQFGVSAQGIPRSMERARAEARKCVLLCANCHAEVEAGARTLTLESRGVPIRGSSIGRAFDC